MTVGQINQRMDQLERDWFEAHRIAQAASLELAGAAAGEDVRGQAAARRADALLKRQNVLKEIEALEDSLLVET